MLKNEGKDPQRIWEIITEVWETEEIPEYWKTIMIWSIHKKGNRNHCDNCRGIIFLNIAYKTFTNYILDYQGSFKTGRVDRQLSKYSSSGNFYKNIKTQKRNACDFNWFPKIIGQLTPSKTN